jgi:hypothetical protein
VDAAILEADPGAGYEILDLLETMPSPGAASAATRAPMCTATPPAFPSMSSHSPACSPALISMPKLLDCVAHGARATDRTRGPVEACKEPVPSGVNLAAAEASELAANAIVVLG